MDKNTLQMVGTWAKSRVASGEEPPWTFHKLKQLADITETLAASMDAVVGIDTSTPHKAATCMDAGSNIVQIDSFRPPKSEPEVLLPA